MANPYDKYLSEPAAADEAVPNVQDTPAAESADLTLGGRAVDLARAGVGALRDMAQGVVQAPLAIGEALSPITDKAFGLDSNVTKQGFKEVRSKLSFSEVEPQQTVLGGVVRTLGKWALLGGFAGPAGLATSTAGKLAVGAGVNAAQGFLGTAPDETGLTSLLLEHAPSLGDSALKYLATSPTDSEATKRFKGAVENAVAGVAVESLVMAFKAARAAKALRAEGKTAEANAVLAEAAPKIEQKIQKAAGEPIDVSIFPDNVGVYSDSAKGIENAQKEQLVTVFRHGQGQFFGESEGLVEPYVSAGKLHSMQVTAAQLEKSRAANLLAEEAKTPGSVPKDILAEAQKAGNPAHEFVFPKEIASQATEHYGPKGLGATQQVLEATTRVANKEALLERFAITRSRGEDGVTLPLEGTLNYAKYGNDDAIKHLISDVVATTKKDLPDLAGSFQSLKETRELAQLLGKDPTELYVSLGAMRNNAADMAAHITAGKALIKRMATDLHGVATKLSNGLGTDVDKVAFAHMSDVLTSTIDHVSALRTEAARATGAGRMRIGMEGITKENYAKLLEKVGGSDSVSALARRIAAAGDEVGVVAATKGTPGKWMAIHNYIWMNGILGGFKTTFTNVSTTAFNSGLMPGYRIIGGLAEEAAAKFGIKGASAESGHTQYLEGIYQYKMLQYIWKDAFGMAKKAFNAGESILDPSASPLGQVPRGNLLSKDFTGIDNEAIGRGIEHLGTFVGLPSKFLIGQDEFFKQLVYRSHVMSEAYVDGLKRGMDEKAIMDFVNNRVMTSIGEAGKGLDDAGMLAAKNATFTQDLAAETLHGNRTISEGIAGFANAHPAVKGLILPFVKVPSNLLRQAWDMTPGLDLLRTQFRADIAAGGEARAVALGKMGVGTAMWGTAVGLGMSGRITGAGPRDKDLRRQLGPDWKPYSFVFNNDDGTKSYVSFARFDPFGMFFGLAADAAEVGGKIKSQDYDEAATKMVLGLVKNLSSKTYLRATTELLEAASGDESAFKKMIQSRIASYVPGYAQILNTDDELKDVRGWFDGMISRVPGWSSTLESKRDNFGEKIMPPMGYPYTAFNPYTMFRSTNDPVRKELARLAGADIEAKFPLPTPTFGPQGQQVDLREIKNAKGQSAYDRWLELHSKLELGGQTLHESMGELFKSSTYQDAAKALGTGDPLYKSSLATQLVQRQFDMYEKATWQQVTEEFPGLGEAMQKFKVGKKIGAVEGSGTQPNIDLLRGLAGQR